MECGDVHGNLKQFRKLLDEEGIVQEIGKGFAEIGSTTVIVELP